jgi:hypothetical protein
MQHLLTILLFSVLISSCGGSKGFRVSKGALTQNETQYDSTTDWNPTAGTFDSGANSSEVVSDYLQMVGSPLYPTGAPAEYVSELYQSDPATGSKWASLSWTPKAPYGKALPDNTNDNSEVTAYSEGGIDMTGVLALYHFDASGSDSSPNSNNLGIGAGTAGHKAAGKFGTALTFQGNNDSYYMDVPAGTTDFQHSDMFAVFMWVHPEGTCDSPDNANEVYASQFGQTDTNGTWWFGCQGSDNQLYIKFWQLAGQDLALTDASALMNDNQWHHVGFIWNNGTLNLYFDGYSVASGTIASFDGGGNFSQEVANTEPFCIGGYKNANCDTFNLDSSLDEILVMKNGNLGSADVLNMYKRGLMNAKIQVCNQATCGAGDWKGPDGSNSTYFSEADNSSASKPSFDLSSLNLTEKYMTYKVFLETSDSSYTPAVKDVTIPFQ